MNVPGPSLYDLAPALHVMLMGLTLALGPLAWIWLRRSHRTPADKLAALARLLVFLTFDLVLFGAFTRLTDSGLGCPDWPGCYGNASPFGAVHQIAAAQQALPTGPVTHAKAWIEMIHRYLATGIGVLIITLVLASWRERRRGANVSVGWPLMTLGWVCLQGAFGALTVTLKLTPLIVTLHLLGGMVLLALLVIQARPSAGHSVEAAANIRRWLTLSSGFVWCQIALGAWVSSNYAVLACSDFPQCQSSWWPPMNFEEGFTLVRGLGVTAAGENISFQALTAIHFTHRLFAALVVIALAALIWRLRTHEALARYARWLAALMAWQLLSGISNVVLGWPLVAALAHTAGAAALVVTLTLLAGRLPRAALRNAVGREPMEAVA